MIKTSSSSAKMVRIACFYLIIFLVFLLELITPLKSCLKGGSMVDGMQSAMMIVTRAPHKVRPRSISFASDHDRSEEIPKQCLLSEDDEELLNDRTL